jgi:hypothetical protein
MTTDPKNPPVRKFSLNSISLSVFAHGQPGSRTTYSAALQKHYRRGNDWVSSETITFFLRDMAALARIVSKCQQYLEDVEMERPEDVPFA